ncbi:hypothetical protein D2917_29545 [Cupriavidus oxalaticus]|uniref:Uncharacterized protein n=1 Tax=Cupriavidus oxalaticus TaxID=96344 RepID=A0A5P3VPN8_9BURK|nr:hypothetical protein D2917_29545 [Cupriavidus oxalaticus]
MVFLVVPAQAGTQWLSKTLDSRLRGNDVSDCRGLWRLTPFPLLRSGWPRPLPRCLRSARTR